MPALRASRPSAAVAASLLLLLGAVAPVPASAAATDGGVAWSVQTADNDNGTGRGNFGYTVDPGAVIRDTMIVANTGTVELPLAVYAADAFTTSAGDIDLVTGSEASADAGRWVHVDAPSLTLAPGQRGEVPFTIAVPADARPGDHSAGIVTSYTSSDAAQSLAVDRRLGTRINLRVAGELVPAVEVTDVTATYSPSWNPFAPGTLSVEYSARNSGNTRIVGASSITAAGPAGLLGIERTGAGVAEIIPGSTVRVRDDVPVLALGWLGGTVSVSAEAVGLGAGPLAPVTVEFATPAVPWPLILLIVAVAGSAVAVVLAVRRRMNARAVVAEPQNA